MIENAPKKFSDIGAATATKGRCERCGVMSTVCLEVKATTPSQGKGTGAGKTLKRDKAHLCEECAVGLYLTFTRVLHQPKGVQRG